MADWPALMTLNRLRERLALFILPTRPTEIRPNDDGTVDEVVGYGFLHVEQMDANRYWAALDELGSDRRIMMWWDTARARIKLHAHWE